MSQPSTELYHLTIREAAGLIESKQLSPVELTQAFPGPDRGHRRRY